MLTISRAKQIAMFVAVTAVTIYKFLEDIEQPTKVVQGGRGVHRPGE